MPVITTSTFISIADGLLKIFGLVREGKVLRDAKFDAALSHLYTAACETLHYSRLLKEGTPVNRETERTLTKLWHLAGVSFRTIDVNLSEICMLKGKYWLDPTKWTDEDIKNREIGIERVYAQAKQLLYAGY